MLLILDKCNAFVYKAMHDKENNYSDKRIKNRADCISIKEIGSFYIGWYSQEVI